MDEKEKEKLFNDLIKAKKAEDQAKDKRIELEEEIAELYTDQIDGKSKTFNEVIGKNKFKITVSKTVNVTFDQDAYAKTRLNIPEDLRPEKIQYKLDAEGMAWLAVNKPELYRSVSDCLSEKPGKTGVKIEKI